MDRELQIIVGGILTVILGIIFFISRYIQSKEDSRAFFRYTQGKANRRAFFRYMPELSMTQSVIRLDTMLTRWGQMTNDTKKYYIELYSNNYHNELMGPIIDLIRYAEPLPLSEAFNEDVTEILEALKRFAKENNL